VGARVSDDGGYSKSILSKLVGKVPQRVCQVLRHVRDEGTQRITGYTMSERLAEEASRTSVR
jgi:hypothetical protein